MSTNQEKTSSMKNTSNNVNNYPIIGFLPAYLPKEFSNSDSSSSSTSKPLIKIKVDPPPSISNDVKKPMHSKNFPSIYSIFKNNQCELKATAPTIEEINSYTVIKMPDKNDVLKEFTKLINNKEKINSNLEFEEAEKNIIELLSNKKTQLTIEEKNGFLVKLNNIRAERKNFLKKRQRKKVKDSCYTTTIFQSILIVVHIILFYFCILYKDDIHNVNLIQFIVFSFLVTVALIMLYALFMTEKLYYVLDILFSSAFSCTYLFIFPPGVGNALILLVMYLLGFIFLMEILTKIYSMATKSASSDNFTSQVPLKKSSKTDNNSHKKLYTSVHYRSGSNGNSNSYTNFHQTSHIFHNHYSSSPVMNVDELFFEGTNDGDNNDYQDDNNCEDNNQDNNQDNNGENFYNENYSNTCNAADYDNYDNGGDYGCQDTDCCDE
ncbi:presenilin-A-like [Leptopilina heterotoma]|uniref:presenilin-A-like n=1 Tax=Leptopilina heterotoma TaxID=63436 RepID=UPI001CA8F910|nr:presenilin-A-like [Leptopilina heterotoma]